MVILDVMTRERKNPIIFPKRGGGVVLVELCRHMLRHQQRGPYSAESEFRAREM